jgi:PIN domain nuclease of toxin-antitoxin system
MSDFVLDSSAVLAMIFSEPGKERVEEVLDTSTIARINFIEVFTKLLERGSSLGEAHEALNELGLIDYHRIGRISVSQECRIAGRYKAFGLVPGRPRVYCIGNSGKCDRGDRRQKLGDRGRLPRGIDSLI